MALTTVRPQGMGFNTGRRNLIINGAMQVAQRGTSNTTSAAYLIDRFKTDFSGGALTNEQVSLTSSDTPYSYGFRNAHKLTNTTAGSAATTDYRRMQQVVEAQNVAGSGWNYTSSSSYITLSFWVKSSVAGTYACNLQSNDGTAQNYSFEYTVVADTWTKITHTASGDSGITVNNDNGEGLRIYWWPYLGTNFTTSGHTNEAWAAYNSTDQVKDFAQNWASTLNATFFVTGVQLEVGENASDFEHRSFGEELMLCQRYYQRKGGGTYESFGAGSYYGTTATNLHVTFPAGEMRTAPSFSSSAVSTFTMAEGRSSFVLEITAFNYGYASTTGALFQPGPASAGTTDTPYVLCAKATNNAWMAFDAEL